MREIQLLQLAGLLDLENAQFSAMATPQLDFFFWGHIKNVVYAEKIRDINHLRERIIAAVETVTPAMLANTWRAVEYRLDVCRATNGSHVEVY